MQELIVLFACLNSHGCTGTLYAYEYYNPQIVAQVEQTANRFKTGYEPFAICAVGLTCTVSLTPEVKISTSKDSISLNWQITLP